MEKKPLIILALVLLFLAGGLVYLNLFILKPKISPQPVSKPPTQVFRETSIPSPAPTVDQAQVQKVLKEGGVIPFDYEVIGVSENLVTVTGARGKAGFSNDPNLKIFKKTEDTQEEVSFSYLKVGQKIQVEKKPPGEEGITVYILD